MRNTTFVQNFTASIYKLFGIILAKFFFLAKTILPKWVIFTTQPTAQMTRMSKYIFLLFDE